MFLLGKHALFEVLKQVESHHQDEAQRQGDKRRVKGDTDLNCDAALSAQADGFELLTSFGKQARTGTLVSDFYSGPTSRFDLDNELVVDLLSGTLESVTDLTLFGGANALAVETASGVWEIVQAGAAELLALGRYRLTRLLRGQRGTESAMGNPAPAGARVVVLDTALASLPIAEADLGIPWNWRIGPASRPVSDETYLAQAFTPAGAGLRPSSVAHVEQPWRKRRSPGDLTIRLPSADGTTAEMRPVTVEFVSVYERRDGTVGPEPDDDNTSRIGQSRQKLI